MGEGLVVAHSLRYSQSTTVEKSKQQKLEAAGHVASTVRREQCIPLSPLYSLGNNAITLYWLVLGDWELCSVNLTQARII